MITRADKQQEITHLSEKFKRAQASFLVDFKGMNVEEVTKLRKKLTLIESEMKVVRNTLAVLALKEHPELDPAFSENFVGTNAIVFAYGEAPPTAKILKDYCGEVEELVLKAGLLDGRSLDERGIKALADLPSKEVLRAMFLGLLSSPMSKFVGTLNAVPSGFVRVLNAHKQNIEKVG